MLTYLFFISAAIVKKACSTFVVFLAEASKNGIPRLSANSLHKVSICSYSLNSYLSCVEFHSSFVCQITLVAYQQLVNILAGVSVNFLQPLFNVVKRNLICNIIYNYNSMGSSVIATCDYRNKNKYTKKGSILVLKRSCPAVSH